MTEPTSIAITDLLEHSSWMRALARSLVRDPHEAEDVVQDAWVDALRRPPADSRNLRGWLAKVVRNVARQRHRGDARRREREAASEVRDAEHPVDRVVAQFEMQQRVADLVLALGEPERTILLLRFYEGLDSPQIAARTGVNANTVRWHLSRALASLRSALDRAHDGDRHRWCLALAPFLRPEVATTTAAAAAATFLTGALTVKLLALSAAAVGVAVFVTSQLGLFRPDAMPLPPEEPVAVEFRALAGVGEGGGTVATPDVDRRAEPSLFQDEPEPGAGVHPVVHGVVGRVVDEQGRPLGGATVRDYSRTHQAGADGRFLVPFERPEGPDSTRLTVAMQGFATRELPVQWVESVDDVTVGDVVLRRGGAVRGRIIDADGAPAGGATVGVAHRVPSAAEYRTWRLRQAGGHVSGSPVATTAADGTFVLAGLPVGMLRLVATGPERMATLSSPVEVRAGMESAGVEIHLEELDPAELIEGIVLDPLGNPVPRAHLRYRFRRRGGSGSGTVLVDLDGRFRLVVDVDAGHTLHASDPDGRYRDAIRHEVSPGTRDVVLRLTEPVFTHLELGAAAGTPYTLALRSPEHDASYGYHTGLSVGDAPFAFPVPASAFVLEVDAQGHDLLELGPFDPDSCPDPIRGVLRRLPGVRGLVRSTDGPVTGAQVSIQRLAREHTVHNGFPTTLDPGPVATTVTGAEGAFVATLRTAGEFVVRVEHAGFAPAELGPFAIDPERGLDGIEAVLDQGGSIAGEVRSAAGPVAGAIVGVSRGDGHAVTQRSGVDGAFRFDRLMPGPWTVQLVEEDIAPMSSSTMTDGYRSVGAVREDCQVVAGGVTRHDLFTDGAAGGCTLRGRFQLGEEDMGGWRFDLVDAAGSVGQVVATAQPTSRGEFTLVVPPGPYRLSLAPTGADRGLDLLVELTVDDVDEEWSRIVPAGAVTITDLPTGRAEGPDADIPVLLTVAGDVLGVVRLRPDANGAVTLDAVPAGEMRLLHLSPRDMARRDGDPRTWPSRQSFPLAAGERRTVAWDG